MSDIVFVLAVAAVAITFLIVHRPRHHVHQERCGRCAEQEKSGS